MGDFDNVLKLCRLLVSTDRGESHRLKLKISSVYERGLLSARARLRLAMECGVTVAELDAYELGSRGSEFAKIERRMILDVVDSFLEQVRHLPDEQRFVVVSRMHGKSWRSIGRLLPGRVFFSIMEDYERAVRVLSQSSSYHEIELFCRENFIIYNRKNFRYNSIR